MHSWSTEQNKQLALRWKDQIWNKRNMGIIDELYAPDYVGHIVGAPGPVRGREALQTTDRRLLRRLRHPLHLRVPHRGGQHGGGLRYLSVRAHGRVPGDPGDREGGDPDQ